MLAAFVTSTLFLISYLYYHLVLRAGVTHFQGEGISRPIYFTILISHTILAVVVVPFILITLYRALKGRFAAAQGHRSLHLRHLDVRLGDRRGDLPDAVQGVCEISCQLSARQLAAEFWAQYRGLRLRHRYPRHSSSGSD